MKAGEHPPPIEIKSAREAVGLTQAAAASLVYCNVNTWQKWESGYSKMHPGFWELFKIKTRRSKR
ncbi:transcriptional regulator [Nitrosospira lacus]|uniref:Transcriptional regulator n=1 Tax=Nitrosospira lacus TaxID=1288494 RepID=A0A1W6STN4_9PROT|nr:transcriptional regulator [Nitrosospira lacus]